MGSNTSITSAMAKSVLSGQTSINSVVGVDENATQHKHHHDEHGGSQKLSKASQWSKSSPALKPTRPYRSNMKRSSRSVPNMMDEDLALKEKGEHQSQSKSSNTTNDSGASAVPSNESSPSVPSQGSTGSPTSNTTPEVHIVEDANKPVLVKSKSRPNAISYANFLNHQHTLIFTDDSLQERYFDRYYPPISPDVEEKLKTVDKKARPKTANAYVKAKSASNLKISAPNLTTTSAEPSPSSSLSPGENNPLVAKPMSPIVSLYSRTSPNNTTQSLQKSNSHSFGLTVNNSSRNTTATSPNNTLQPHNHHTLQRSSSHSVGLTLNKSPTHSPSISPSNKHTLQTHPTLKRGSSQSSVLTGHSKSPINSSMPQGFHKLTPTTGTSIIG